MEFINLSKEIEQYMISLKHFEEVNLSSALNGNTPPKDARLAILCRNFLGEVRAKARDYDNLTTIARGNWGERTLEIIRTRDTSLDALRDLAIGLAQCAREYAIKTPFVYKEGAEALIKYFEPTNPSLETEGERHAADYITYGLARDIFQETMQRHQVQQVAHEKKIEEWEASLKGWDQKVVSHEGTMKNLHLRYNLVELSKAFWEMYKNKDREKNLLLVVVIVFGLVLLLPIVAQLPIADTLPLLAGLRVTWSTDQWPKVLPLITLEVVNLYFFRIFLHNFYSTKAQLLQLDLRQALCAFIESYVDFAKEKLPSQKDANPLAKFEAIVFSGLTPDPEKVPSSFDGIDNLLKIAKEFKKTP